MTPPLGPADRLGPDRLVEALAAIDLANAADPTIVTIDGRTGPKELLHSEMVSEWLWRLDPAPTEAQQLAARAHHLRRWTSPRDAYPAGRSGYLRWRAAARQRHVEDVTALLELVAYDEATISRVGEIIAKTDRQSDPQVQTHEDALCLVFLSSQLDDVAADLGDDHTARVLGRTVAKMSDAALTQAAQLGLSDHAAALLAAAVGTGRRG